MSLPRGDYFEKYKRDGADFQENSTPVRVGSDIEGNLQFLSVRDTLLYQSRGQMSMAKIFFDFDPELSINMLLKHVRREDGSVPGTEWYMIRGVKTQGPPGKTWLWIAMVEQQQQQGDFGVS